MLLNKTNEGGRHDMAIAYLVSLLGPVYEYQNLFDVKSVLSPVLNPLFHIQNIVFLKRDNFTDNNAIKEAILKYGAVATKMYYSTSYLKDDLNYYYNGIIGCNHAVCIVGWDDNYSKNNFKKTPQGNGAWIVKNSWGNSSGHGGYFYVSYYDTKFAQIGKNDASYTFILNDTVKHDKIYQYDIVGKTDYLFTNKNSIYYKNIFKSTDNEFISAVSDHTYNSQVACIKVFTILNEVNTTLNLSISLDDNKLDLTANIYNEYGYPLQAGNVIFYLDNLKYTVPVKNGKVSLNHVFMTKGERLISAEYVNSGYKSLKKEKSINVENIKFIPTNLNGSNLTVYYKSGVLTLILEDYYLNPISDALISINNKKIKTNANGIAKLNLDLNVGLHILTAYFNGKDDYLASNTSLTIKVLSTIKANDFSRGYNSAYDYKATFLDSKGRILANKKIIFMINNKKHNLKTNSKGIATLKVKLATGTYLITLINPQTTEKVSKTLKIIPILKENKNVVNYFGATTKYKLRVYGDNGKAVGSGVSITFKVNSKSYTIKTNKYGYAILKIKLNIGKYTIKTTYKSFKVANKITVKPVLITKDIKVKKAKKIKFTAKLVNIKGKTLYKRTITFKFKEKTYKVKTNSKGIAKISLKNLKVGKYKIYSIYTKSKIKNTITVIN
ncbi:C1 family peptidase [Methanobrevibacter oralis]|uniref:Bacterial Ig-like domain protein n=2 Tax=Methanobrevibacter oralis TaxID=66851 RepID=A0A166B1K3_METOA|nr:C1 family peptidase [Methanobrevibacter oralis]KZX12751.1 bacterial Ig-like domain protein [Methanobrevibacter oralis]